MGLVQGAVWSSATICLTRFVGTRMTYSHTLSSYGDVNPPQVPRFFWVVLDEMSIPTIFFIQAETGVLTRSGLFTHRKKTL